jgi:transposase
MANHSINMLTLRRILQLKRQGTSNRQIALTCDLSRDTVNLYVQRIIACSRSIDTLLEFDDETLAGILMAPPVPPPADERWEDLKTRLPDLSRDLSGTHMTRRVLWERYKKEFPGGYSYTQFCEHLQRYLRTTKAVMHLEHRPAEQTFTDYAGDKLYYYDPASGAAIACPVFVSVLPFSGYAYIEAQHSQQTEQMLHAMNRMVRYMDGVTESVTSDNMKQYVIKTNRYEPTFNDIVLQWSCHYNTTLMATRVASPRDKAAVESTINSVYKRIYPYLKDKRPRSLAELNAHILEVLEQYNNAPMQKKDLSRRQAFEQFERHLLRPLPKNDFVPKTTAQAKVAPDYHVQVTKERHKYSVPYTFIGQIVRIIYDTDHIEIYSGNTRIACHRRSYVRSGYTSLEDHMPPQHRFYQESRGWTSDYFLSRAERVGPETVNVISIVLNKRQFREQNFKSCLGILKLADKYTPLRLEAACRRLNGAARVNYQMLQSILAQRLDQAPLQQGQRLLTDHENIRGADAFNLLGHNN